MGRLRISTLFFFAVFLSSSGKSAPPAKHLYPIIWQWMQGKSDSAYYFNQGSHPELIKKLTDAYQVRRAREFWYQKNLPSFIDGRRQWLPMSDFLGRFQTIRGVWRSGFDMVEQTLGGFTVHIHPVDKDSIEFTVLDMKSRWSLFLHLPFIRNVDHNKERPKRMMNSYWIFNWREPVSNALFFQRQFNQRFRKRHYTGHNF